MTVDLGDTHFTHPRDAIKLTLSTIIGQEELTNESHLEVVQRSLRHVKRRDIEVKSSIEILKI